MQFSITKKATNERRRKNPLGDKEEEQEEEEDTRIQIEKQSQRNAEKAARIQDLYGEETFAYDEVYDAMKSGQERAREKKEGGEQKDRNQPRYMQEILAAAQVRKRDKERARDAKLQREREQEGDDFKDKERFVTGAYKRQQEELKRQEKEEEEEEQRLKRTKQSGLSSMYRQLLDESQQANQAAMEAAKSSGKTETSKRTEEEEKQAQPRPSGVTVNDEGEIVDKRQLLKPGLNVANKKRQHDEQDKQVSSVDTKSQKTKSDISSAKARYLARKAKQQEH